MSVRTHMIFNVIVARNLFLSIFYPFSVSYWIRVPYVSAEPGNCGIGCVCMLLNNTLTVHDLEKKYKRIPYYTERDGWAHRGIAQILNDFHMKAIYKKYQSPITVMNALSEKKPVLVSLRVPEIVNLGKKQYLALDRTKKSVGHLCLVVGIDKKNVILHDPRNNGVYSKHTYISLISFSKIFTGNCFVIENYLSQ